MTEHHPVYGENEAYDAKVERESAAKKAYMQVTLEKVAKERRLFEAKQALEQAKAAEQQARFNYQQAVIATASAKRTVADADKDLRTGRRAINAQLQSEAAARGDKTYLTGTPCRNGHAAYRYVSSGACVECDRIGWKDGRLASA